MLRETHCDEFFHCECFERDHLVIVSYWMENHEEYPEVSITVHIKKGNIFHRLIFAFKYVLGISSEAGHWYEIVLMPLTVRRLIRTLQTKLDLMAVPTEATTTTSDDSSTWTFTELGSVQKPGQH